MTIKLGVLCPSEIALRRFMPAVCEPFRFCGIAVPDASDWQGNFSDFSRIEKAEREKAEVFTTRYGGRIYGSYSALIDSPDIDAVYIPLPPSLHFKYAEKALEAKKHVFVEKPCTTRLSDTEQLVRTALQKDLVLHENYAFLYHSQIDFLKKMIFGGELGELRLLRMDFGYPFRGESDFRYHKSLGGGALLDIGGYPLILAQHFLGAGAELKHFRLNYTDRFDADISGSATLENERGLTAQISFGSDNEYRCCIDIWGSRGSAFSGRVFSAPAGFIPSVTVTKAGKTEIVDLKADDSFQRSLQVFGDKIAGKRACGYDELLSHAKIFQTMLDSTE